MKKLFSEVVGKVKDKSEAACIRLNVLTLQKKEGISDLVMMLIILLIGLVIAVAIKTSGLDIVELLKQKFITNVDTMF